jgi:hypothetical protein
MAEQKSEVAEAKDKASADVKGAAAHQEEEGKQQVKEGEAKIDEAKDARKD